MRTNLLVFFLISMLSSFLVCQGPILPTNETVPIQPEPVPPTQPIVCAIPAPGFNAWGFCRNVNYPISSRFTQQDINNLRNAITQVDAQYNLTIGATIDNIAYKLKNATEENKCLREIQDLVCASIFRKCVPGERMESSQNLWAMGFPPCISHCQRIVNNCGLNLGEALSVFFCNWINNFYVENIYPRLENMDPRIGMPTLFSGEPNCTNFYSIIYH